MKIIFSVIFLMFSCFTVSKEISPTDWLLWHKVETQLPYSSALTIYPPVTLYAENGSLKGSISTPYPLREDNSGANDEFLIIVTDARRKAHFLKPKLEAVGFVNDIGISISSLSSNSFHNGEVKIQFFKASSPENRQKLLDRENKNIARQQGIEKAIANLNIPKPIVGEVWPIRASTLNGQNIDTIISSSKFTIIQLYSQYCGFCKKAIPSNNALNSSEHIKVIGIAGTKNISDFKKHLNTNDLQYSFVAYKDDYAESALLRSTGQQGFPTYFVLNSSKLVLGIFVGDSSLDSWLTAQAL